MYYTLLNHWNNKFLSRVNPEGPCAWSATNIYDALLFESVDEVLEVLARRYAWAGKQGLVRDTGDTFDPRALSLVQVTEEQVEHTRLIVEEL